MQVDHVTTRLTSTRGLRGPSHPHSLSLTIFLSPRSPILFHLTFPSIPPDRFQRRRLTRENETLLDPHGGDRPCRIGWVILQYIIDRKKKKILCKRQQKKSIYIYIRYSIQKKIIKTKKNNINIITRGYTKLLLYFLAIILLFVHRSVIIYHVLCYLLFFVSFFYISHHRWAFTRIGDNVTFLLEQYRQGYTNRHVTFRAYRGKRVFFSTGLSGIFGVAFISGCKRMCNMIISEWVEICRVSKNREIWY